MSLYIQIRKYLLWIALLVAIVFGAHILVLYFYHDAKHYPQVGGTLHVGLVGENASIDLLSYDPRSSGDETNDMLVHFLYRGLLTYDLDSKKIVEDLGNCGIDTFPTFRCTLNANAFWHDGTPIVLEDVIATYDYYSKSAKNPGFQSRLEKLSVYEDSGEVVFEFDTTDISMLNLLFVPILRKSDIGTFEEQSNFTQYSFSGPFVFVDRKFDSQMQVNQILLSRNAIYGDLKNVYAKNVIISFFPNVEDLASNQSRLHVSVFGDEQVGSRSGDHEYVTYMRPQFFSAFVHSEYVYPELRKALMADVFPRLDRGDETRFKPMDSVFFDYMDEERETPEYTLKEALSVQDYRLGSDPFFAVTVTSDDSEESDEEAVSDSPVEEKEEEGVVDSNTSSLDYITSPFSETPAFILDSNLEISGTPPDGTNNVRVNGYVLKSFVAGSDSFLYRARPEFGNIVEGKNTYTVEFLSSAGSVLAREIAEVYLATSEEQIQTLKDTLWGASDDTPVEEDASDEGEDVDASDEDVVEVEEKAEVILDPSLDPNRYYSEDREPLILKVAYIDTSEYLSDYASRLATLLNDSGIGVELIGLSGEGLSRILSQEESYDVLLTGIHTGIFHYNIFPYFHSGQAKLGQNFSRIRDLELDGFLEELRDKVFYSAPDTLKEVQKNITQILDAKYVVYPLVSPTEQLAYDKELSDVNVPGFFPSIVYLPNILSQSSLHRGFEANAEGKGIGDFFGWLLESIF